MRTDSRHLHPRPPARNDRAGERRFRRRAGEQHQQLLWLALNLRRRPLRGLREQHRDEPHPPGHKCSSGRLRPRSSRQPELHQPVRSGGERRDLLPCSNPPSGSSRGCDNSSSTGGATLTAAGGTYLSSDSLVFETSGEKPNALSILMQGNGSVASGIPLGQGIRCVGGSIIRRLFIKRPRLGPSWCRTLRRAIRPSRRVLR